MTYTVSDTDAGEAKPASAGGSGAAPPVIRIPIKYRLVSALVSCLVALELFGILALIYTRVFLSFSLVSNLLYLLIFAPVLVAFGFFYLSLSDAFNERLKEKRSLKDPLTEAAFAVISGFGALIIYYSIVWLFAKSERTDPQHLSRWEKLFGAIMSLVIFYALMTVVLLRYF